MKKNFFLALMLILCLSVNSQSVTVQQASSVALNYMQPMISENLIVSSIILNEVDSLVCTYTVRFTNDNWCVVSANMSIVPILAFGYHFSTDTIPACVCLLDNYKNEIFSCLSNKNENIVKNTLWNTLLGEQIGTRDVTYTPNIALLNNTGRGCNLWKQTTNNDNSCSNAYNKFCPSRNNDNCECNHTPVGCGAVAMGQVLWYWSWVKNTSAYGPYDWNALPGKLLNSTDIESAEKLAQFLRDCGDAVDMFYTCNGSACLMKNIVSALNDTYGYESARLEKKDDWSYGDAWEDLIRSEIDNNRPVIFYGCNRFDAFHYFVVDGYLSSNSYLFHVNFGHGGSEGFFYLGNIHENHNNNDDYYDLDIRAIVGISPTYQYEINGLSYTQVGFKHHEYAYSTIEVPHTNESLVIKGGTPFLQSGKGNLSLMSGNSVLLKPGFHSERGSTFHSCIDENFLTNMAISVSEWPTSFSARDGSVLELDVQNADSWECLVYDVAGVVIYQGAGSCNGSHVQLWSCPDSYYDILFCLVRLKNSFGRELSNEFIINIGSKDDLSKRNLQKLEKRYNDSNWESQNYDGNLVADIYPNPFHDNICLKSKSLIQKIHIYSENGNQCYYDSNLNNNEVNLSLTYLNNGVYIVVIETQQGLITKKIIKE